MSHTTLKEDGYAATLLTLLAQSGAMQRKAISQCVFRETAEGVEDCKANASLTRAASRLLHRDPPLIKKERLERLIAALEQAEKGGITMSAFDNSEYETARQQYEDEAKQRWGGTDAYKESLAKTAGYSKEQWSDALGGMNGIFAEFADCKNCGESVDSDTAQRLVKKLQNYITEHFYHCTDEILADLGQMYVGDGRFKNNIDKCGEGTAEFVSEAIKIYCTK